ncbi:MAG: M13 family metallopeptidase [Maricaulaceae bacterium]
MTKRALRWGAPAAAALLAACATGFGGQRGEPELGTFGIDLAERDASVAPGDDFYRYLNGQWLDTFEIPADKTNYGSFTVLADEADEQVRDIIEAAAETDAAPGEPEQLIGDLFASFMDEDAIEAAGLDPLRDGLDAIAAAETHEDILRVMARPDLASNGPVGVFVDVDSRQPDQHALYLTHGGLGLPDRDYYLSDAERFAALRTAYEEHIAAMLGLAGVDGAEAKAAGIVALETEIAGAHWERARRRDRDQTYNLMTLDELEEYAPGIDWRLALEESGIEGVDSAVVREKDAFPALAQIFADTPVDVWRDYLTFHVLSAHAQFLPAAFADEDFAFYGQTLSGQPEQRERWLRGVQLVNGTVGFAVGKIYVEEHFSPEAKDAMEQLVANLRAAFAERIQASEWMSEETQVEALDKLAAFTPKIGYPDEWETYEGLEIASNDLLGNIRRANEWGWNDMISDLGQPIDPHEWGMTPQTVNAYYSPNRNEIVFPAAILQPPFFDLNADDAVNYGGIGAVIGHEMGHGFDDQGRKSDGTGMLRDWWTEGDAERFEERAAMLGAQYATYEPIEGYTLNPELTMGENIGDLGGLNVALEAYRISLDGDAPPVIDGYTGEQRFFLAWAQVWRRKYRDEELINRISTDPHSPSEYRSNGVVRNMDAWYEAFGVGPDHALYLPPEERVRIW